MWELRREFAANIGMRDRRAPVLVACTLLLTVAGYGWAACRWSSPFAWQSLRSLVGIWNTPFFFTRCPQCFFIYWKYHNWALIFFASAPSQILIAGWPLVSDSWTYSVKIWDFARLAFRDVQYWRSSKMFIDLLYPLRRRDANLQCASVGLGSWLFERFIWWNIG